MNLPFTVNQFLQVFADYNQAVWPVQLLWNLLALVAVGLAVWKKSFSGRVVSLVLALLWIWIGVVYHGLFFSSINQAAYLFAFLFVLQGLLLLWRGVFRGALSYRLEPDTWGFVSLILSLYALLIYPLIGSALGHGYPYSPTFGLPCPTTIFTMGLLLSLERKPPFYLIIIPLLWSLLGFTAASKLGILEDTGLLVAGAITAARFLFWNRVLHAAPGRAR